MTNTHPSIINNILSPRITEKAALAGDQHCYVFNVIPEATKKEIAKEISTIYKVTPLKVNIARTAGKRRFFRGRWGRKAAVKKAYVFLKPGEKISIM